MDYGCLVLIVDFLNSTTCLNGDRSPIKTKGKHAVFRIQTHLDLYSQCRFGCKYPKLTDNYDKIALKKIIYFDLIPNYDLGYPEELTPVRYLMHSAHSTVCIVSMMGFEVRTHVSPATAASACCHWATCPPHLCWLSWRERGEGGPHPHTVPDPRAFSWHWGFHWFRLYNKTYHDNKFFPHSIKSGRQSS